MYLASGRVVPLPVFMGGCHVTSSDVALADATLMARGASGATCTVCVAGVEYRETPNTLPTPFQAATRTWYRRPGSSGPGSWYCAMAVPSASSRSCLATTAEP